MACTLHYLVIESQARMTEFLNTLQVFILFSHGSRNSITENNYLFWKLRLKTVHHRSIFSIQFIFSCCSLWHQILINKENLASPMRENSGSSSYVKKKTHVTYFREQQSILLYRLFQVRMQYRGLMCQSVFCFTVQESSITTWENIYT